MYGFNEEKIVLSPGPKENDYIETIDSKGRSTKWIILDKK